MTDQLTLNLAQTYKDWEVLEELPPGWVIDKTTGPPPGPYVFVHNGKSPLHGQKRALLKVAKPSAIA